jgi:hypothetical protein
MNEAEKEILRRCRLLPGRWVMRSRKGKCRVWDLGRSEPKPGGYEWETRDKLVSEGDTWEEALASLPEDPRTY